MLRRAFGEGRPLQAVASTCFDTDVSEDGSELRCAFRHCACGSPWVPNDPPSAESLARHVGDAVDAFVRAHCCPSPSSQPPSIADASDASAEQQLCRLAVVVLELDDAHCTLTRWLPALVDALHPARPLRPRVRVVARRFRSRKELLERLLLRGDAAAAAAVASPVLLVVSTHASTQGQVFSTTPAEVRDAHGFEEFCSVHDLAVTAQRAFGPQLAGVYLSSCFSMRLDRSHAEWPVDAAWLADGTLRVDLAGMASELYDTGGHTCDAFVVLAAVARALGASADARKQQRGVLRKLIAQAKTSEFPDLTAEMGLRVFSPMAAAAAAADTASVADEAAMLEFEAAAAENLPEPPEVEPSVHPHHTVRSNLALALVYMQSVASCRALAEALAENVRHRPDIDVPVAVLPAASVHEVLKLDPSRRLLVVVVDATSGAGEGFAASETKHIVDIAAVLAHLLGDSSALGARPFGIHFALEDAPERAAVAAKLLPDNLPCSSFSLAGKPHFWVPLLLYLIHLSAGENGHIPGAVPPPLVSSAEAASPRAHRSWELADVVAECRAVCPGLSAHSGLVLLRPTDTALSAPLPLDATTEAKHEMRKRRKASSGDAQQQQQQGKQRQRRKKSFIEVNGDSQSPSPLDLPLSANVTEVRIQHMAVDLDVDFLTHTLTGIATYRIEDLIGGANKLVLDHSEITVESAIDARTGEPLEFVSKSFCVILHKPASQKGAPFPSEVVLRFKTSPTGRSLLWCKDVENRPCVFTCGSPLNNRSVVPCADAPTELSTLDIRFVVPDGCAVVCSANSMPDSPRIVSAPDQPTRLLYSFTMDKPMPLSTLAVVIGWLESEPVPGVRIPSRIYAPPSLLRSAHEEFADPVSRYFAKVEELLGPFPFDRLDIAVVPSCFGALGLQCPNLTLASPTLIAGDGTMCPRLAHEMTHSYFGLLLGESDWNEQWLSEGFADYTGERIALLTDPRFSTLAEREYHTRLASLLRYRILLNDFRNTDEFAHRLNTPTPPPVMTPTPLLAASTPDAPTPAAAAKGAVIERALEPAFHSIHYLKGYFILRYLATMAGVEAFDGFLHKYVDKFRDKLLTGREAIGFFFSCFPGIVSETINTDHVFAQWVGTSQVGLPVEEAIRKLCDTPEDPNPFVEEVDQGLLATYKADRLMRTTGPEASINAKAEAELILSQDLAQIAATWTPEHFRLFLERLNEGQQLSFGTLELLDKTLHFGKRNADIRHCWCELVLVRKFFPAYAEVERLLVEDQAMGLYIFGELIHGGNRERGLARRIMAAVQSQQDPQTAAKMRLMATEANL